MLVGAIIRYLTGETLAPHLSFITELWDQIWIRKNLNSLIYEISYRGSKLLRNKADQQIHKVLLIYKNLTNV